MTLINQKGAKMPDNGIWKWNNRYKNTVYHSNRKIKLKHLDKLFNVGWTEIQMLENQFELSIKFLEFN